MTVDTVRFTNRNDLPLSVAVWLAGDDYDYIDETKYISATSLLKSTRQIILSSRFAGETPDISDRVAPRMGQSIHSSIEQAWLNNKEEALAALNYPQGIIDRIKVNPDPATVEEGDFPVYMELRSFREIGGYKIGGKFDFVMQGRVEDFKTTSTFSYTNDDKALDYTLQGSIYKWLNEDIITDDAVAINFIFTDWTAFKYKQDPKHYPATRIAQKTFPLLSTAETEEFILNKVGELTKYWDAAENDLPPCTSKELWRKPPAFKYYKNPQKKARSTKNFSDMHSATIRLIEDGNVGVIDEVPGEVVACKYCDAFSHCTQKDTYIANGSLR